MASSVFPLESNSATFFASFPSRRPQALPHKVGAGSGKLLLLVLSLVLAFCEIVPGQVTSQATGLPAFGSYQTSPVDTVNLATLGVHLEVPVRSKAVGIAFVAKFVGENPRWNASGGWIPGWDPTVNCASGPPCGPNLRPTTSMAATYFNFNTAGPFCHVTNPTDRGFGDFRLKDSSNTLHTWSFLKVDDQGCTYPTSASASSDDGLFTMSVTTILGFAYPQVTIFDQNGVAYAGGMTNSWPFTATDPNGNQIIQSYPATYTDATGSVVLDVSIGNPTTTASYTDAAGASRSFAIAYASYTIRTAFGCSGRNEQLGTMTATLVSSISLPDGSQYQFTYEPTPGFPANTTGRIKSITLPWGGTITYNYNGSNNGASCSDGGTSGFTKTTPDGVWQYSRSYNSTTRLWTTTVIDPSLNRSVYTFSSGNAGQGPYYEVQRQTYTSSSTLLETVVTCYNGNSTNCATTYNINPFPSTTPMTQKDTYRTLPGVAGAAVVKTSYTPVFELVTEVQSYDFGGTTPISDTITSYGACAPIFSRPCSITTKDGAGSIKAQTNYGYDQYGNLQTTDQLVSGSQYIHKSFTYAANGALQTATDGNSNQTIYTNSACNGLLPTTVSAGGLSTSMTWDCNGGVMTSRTDENQQTTTYNYLNSSNAGDPFWRLFSTSYPDGGQTSTTYDSVPPFSATATTKVTASIDKVSTVIADTLGRVQQSRLSSDLEGIVYTDTTYDANGRLGSISNPYRSTSDPTYGITVTQYDGLDRVTKVVPQDGSATTNNVSTAYSGNCATVSDETLRKRKSCTDGLGRITQVFEDPDGVNYETDYVYDTLNNLIGVTQKGGTTNSALWRLRTFQYDSLSRLTSATNPESGTITYTYDNNGNVLTKVSPRANQTGSLTMTTTYTYDPLNRLTQKSYSGVSTPTVKFGYDGVNPAGCTPPAISGATDRVGRRSGMCDGSGATAWSFDPMGRPLVEQRKIAASTAITDTIAYTYNKDGSVATITYPSGRILTYAPSAAGRPLSAVDSANNLNYVTAATYAPHGALTGFQNGASISARWSYNPRLQPLQIYFTTGTVPTITGSTCPTTAPTIMGRIYNFGAGVNNNGNVNVITDCINTDRSQNFHYDNLNRITDAYTNGQTTSVAHWGEVYTVDPWGNLTNIAPKPGWQHSELLNAAPATTKNQLNGFVHDSAGNNWANGTYTYDAENRLKSTAGYTYVYDGDGKRVIKCNGTYPTCASATLYWTGAGSDTLDETDWTGVQLEEYIFFNGKRVARRDGTTNTVRYYFADHLGSTDVITGSGGGIQKVSTYYPFGGEIAITAPSFANTYKFTGKERDSESGLDNFGARYNASSLGRFMSSDPKMPRLKHLVNPQKWNKYAYTINNPIRYFDPDGLEEMDIQLRTFIKATSVGDPMGRRFGGDGRDFTTSQNVTSRTSITVRIETDASTRPGNPIISVTSPPAGHTNQVDASGNVVNTGQQTEGLPTVTGRRDANGNAVLNFQENAKNPLEPQSIPLGIRVDLNVTVPQNGSSITTVGDMSATPSAELNVGTEGGALVNIPLQSEPSGDTNFGLGLFQTNWILNVTPLPPPPPGCAQDKEKSCSH